MFTRLGLYGVRLSDTGGGGGNGGGGGTGSSDNGGNGGGNGGGGAQGGGTDQGNNGGGGNDFASLPEWAQKQIKDLRGENANHRNKLKGFEDAEEERKRASMSESEKQADALKKAETAATEALGKVRATVLQLHVERAARKLGVVDEDAAFKLLDTSKVTFDGDNPTNVDDLLKGLIESKPWLTNGGTDDQQNNGGGNRPNNASRQRTSAGGTFTTSQIADRAFYEKNRDEIMKAMGEGRIVEG